MEVSVRFHPTSRNLCSSTQRAKPGSLTGSGKVPVDFSNARISRFSTALTFYFFFPHSPLSVTVVPLLYQFGF